MNRVTVKPSPSVVRVVTECLCEVAERTGKEVGALEMAKWYEAFAVCQPFELREAFDNHALTSLSIRRHLGCLADGQGGSPGVCGP